MSPRTPMWTHSLLTTHYSLPLFTLKNKFFKPQPGTQPVGLIRSTLRIFVGVRSSDFQTFGRSFGKYCTVCTSHLICDPIIRSS